MILDSRAILRVRIDPSPNASVMADSTYLSLLAIYQFNEFLSPIGLHKVVRVQPLR